MYKSVNAGFKSFHSPIEYTFKVQTGFAKYIEIVLAFKLARRHFRKLQVVYGVTKN